MIHYHLVTIQSACLIPRYSSNFKTRFKSLKKLHLLTYSEHNTKGKEGIERISKKEWTCNYLSEKKKKKKKKKKNKKEVHLENIYMLPSKIYPSSNQSA
jgi:hypothetical protein